MSMGFATWVITQEMAPVGVTGGIQAEPVITTEECMTLQEDSLSLGYSLFGFTDPKEGNDYAADMVVTYAMNVDVCRQIYGNVVDVNIIFNFDKALEENNLFTEKKYLTAELPAAFGKDCPYASEQSSGFAEVQAEGGVAVAYVIHARLDLLSIVAYGAASDGVLPIQIAYSFDFEDYATYRNYFYMPVAVEEAGFSIKAKLTEVKS